MADERKIRDMVRRVVYRTVGKPLSARPVPKRKLVTEADINPLPEGSEFAVPEGALVTPLARQIAMERKVRLVEGNRVLRRTKIDPPPATGSASSGRSVALGADHGGYELKEEIKRYLSELGFESIDCGTHSKASVDYPDFAFAVAQLVVQGRAWRGIIVDGAGIGSCMAANKVPGVRAAMCYDQSTAINSREHNDANVLTLGAGLLGINLARQIVKVWLETPAGGGRHARRVEKIMDIESRFVRT